MRSRLPRLIWAAPVAAAFAATLAAAGGSPPAESPAVRSISGRLDAGVSTVLIESSEPVAYLTSQPDPLTVFVDLRNVRPEGLDDRALGDMPSPVKSVQVDPALASDGAPLTRVTVELERPAQHRVRSSRNVIYVEVDRGAGQAPPTVIARNAAAAAMPGAAAPAASRQDLPASRTLATRLTGVRPMALPNGTAIALSGNGRLIASRVEDVTDLPARVLLDFEGVAMGNVPAATSIDDRDIRRVRVGVNSADPLITRVVIDMARRLPYTVQSVGEELRVLFTRAAETAAEMVMAPASAATPEPRPVAEDVPVVTNTDAAPLADAPDVRPDMVPVPAAAAAPAPAIAEAAAASIVQAVPAEPAPSAVLQAPTMTSAERAQTFTGHPVTFDFQGADLRAVLRTFAEISGLNMVIDSTIQGTVDVSLKEVPWDQALDIILKANKLGYNVDGTIVRIAPLQVLAQENEEQRKLTEARALAGELRVLTHPLSYAKAEDLVSIITNSSLSSRGEVQVDTRTNTLIIRDLADRLAAATDLIVTLDKPQPQVEIEARIVQTTRDFARAIGVQWGVNGRMDPSLGNATNLAFPNAVEVGGRMGGTQGPGGASTGVNLPAPSPTSALGVALGSINGALNLDVALTALESSGKGRILSTPRVSTQNNVEAEITQGQQIPIQTQANNTITVTFKDAALTLRVLPQITAAGTVIMRITLENAAANYSLAVNGIPPIDTQRAVTSVLVADGDTTVIGGIYISTEQAKQGRTPLLSRIPLLGWLFRSDEVSDQSRELLIFITPRITKG